MEFIKKKKKKNCRFIVKILYFKFLFAAIWPKIINFDGEKILLFTENYSQFEVNCFEGNFYGSCLKIFFFIKSLL